MSVILGSFSIIIMWYILLRGKSKTFYSKTKVLAKLLNLVLDWVLVDHCLSSSIIPNFFAGVHTFVRAHIFKVFKVITTLSYLLHSWSVHKSLVHTAVPVFFWSVVHFVAWENSHFVFSFSQVKAAVAEAATARVPVKPVCSAIQLCLTSPVNACSARA